MAKWFMLNDNGKHHKLDEGIDLHYPNTCNVHNVRKGSNIDWARRSTAIKQRSHLAHLAVESGVDITYETKGLITFVARSKDGCREAWQRIEWKPNSHPDWTSKEVQNAIDNFMWVAKCENEKRLVPKKWWLKSKDRF